MTVVFVELRRRIHLPIGIQILASANKEALAVAKAAELEFIRTEVFTFAHVADEGYMESCAGELLRYRKMIECGEHFCLYRCSEKTILSCHYCRC